MTEQNRELVLHQIIDELFQIAPPGAIKQALWQRYLNALPLQQEEPAMRYCVHCGQHHPVAAKEYYCPLDPRR